MYAHMLSWRPKSPTPATEMSPFHLLDLPEPLHHFRHESRLESRSVLGVDDMASMEAQIDVLQQRDAASMGLYGGHVATASNDCKGKLFKMLWPLAAVRTGY